MTNDLNHNLELPAGITADDLVDLVDGVLPKAREGVVIEALRHAPRLGLLIKQMRADRADVAELAEVRIPQPVGMVDAIEAKLNREALSALVAESEEIPASIPISSVIPQRRGIVTVLAENLWARRLATAASLAIVAGLGFFAVRELSKTWPKLPAPGPIADNTPTNTNTETSTDFGKPDKIDVAVSPVTDEDPLVAPTTGKAKTSEEAAALAAAGVPAELTLPEALRLAEAGRLVIRVRSDNYEGTLRHLQELSRSSGRDSRWRAFELNGLPVEYAALASPLPDTVPPIDTTPRPERPTAALPVYAGEESNPPTPLTVKPDAPVGIEAAPVQRHVRAVRIVQTSADTRSLDDLLKDIAVHKSHSAAFYILPESAAAEPAPMLDAESILWWSRGSTAWAKRVSVPVVVETVE